MANAFNCSVKSYRVALCPSYIQNNCLLHVTHSHSERGHTTDVKKLPIVGKSQMIVDKGPTAPSTAQKKKKYSNLASLLGICEVSYFENSHI